jgi:hypothetical protein
MARKRHAAEESVVRLRQVDALTVYSRYVSDAIRAIVMTTVSEERSRI